MKIIDGSTRLNDARKIIEEYLDFVKVDLSFQNVDYELEHLKEKYTGKNGKILLALNDSGEVIGVIAYYRHSNTRCEAKRFFVKEKYRGQNIGEQLLTKLISLAKKEGYKEMVLDTMKSLKDAIRVYKEYGFKEIDAYYNNPLDNIIYMKLDL